MVFYTNATYPWVEVCSASKQLLETRVWTQSSDAVVIDASIALQLSSSCALAHL